jgi:hypothetical protein
VAADAMTDAQRAQLARASSAGKELSGRMLARVTERVTAAGHVAAIDTCKQEAPTITAEIAAAQGVRLGRTAARLRSPTNTAPEWAKPLIAQAPQTPQTLVRDDGTLAALLPIRLAEACVACHGAPDKLAPGVADALASRYPDDQATGFAPGDLRGWLWVEVPPEATR